MKKPVSRDNPHDRIARALALAGYIVREGKLKSGQIVRLLIRPSGRDQ